MIHIELTYPTLLEIILTPNEQQGLVYLYKINNILLAYKKNSFRFFHLYEKQVQNDTSKYTNADKNIISPTMIT